MLKKFLLGCLVVISGLSCGGGETPLFVMELEQDFVIPAGLNNFDSHYFILKDVPTRIANYAITTTNDVDRIQSSRASLEGRVQELDFSIISDIIIEVISKSEPPIQKEIFYNDRIPLREQNELLILSSLSDVSDILTEELVDLSIRIVFRRITPREYDTRLLMTFNAYATE